MSYARLGLRFAVLIFALILGAYLFALITDATSAQSSPAKNFRPDVRRAIASKTSGTTAMLATLRAKGYTPQRGNVATLDTRPRANARRSSSNDDAPEQQRRPIAHRALSEKKASGDASARALINSRISPGTSLGRVLHTSQLSLNSSAGSVEQFADRDGDLEADERATFDTQGGAFDLAVGRSSGARYEVYSAIDDRGTSNGSDDRSIGVFTTALDINGDFSRDASSVIDLYDEFDLPSAVSVVSGTSRGGREFVIVSSSGYYNYSDANDPDNEPTAGIALIFQHAPGQIDYARSRTLIEPGGGQLNNANALTLLPTGDLLIADFDSNELRIVRDTNDDNVPDTLDSAPYYSYEFSNDAPLDIAANSRGIVFSHSVGNDTVMLALYDTDANGYADAEEVVVEGLSIDDSLILHGLTVDRVGTVYVIEDALGASDTVGDGGNGGTPLVDAFPDPALNGVLRNGALYVTADNPTSQALAGLAFGTDPTLAPVATLSLTNSASRRGNATRNGLGTILGAGLTGGRSGASAAEATRRGVRVTIEGTGVPVHSFSDGQLNIYVPDAVGTGARSVVVSVEGKVIAAEDVSIVNVNPGLFTVNGTGAGDAVALLASGLRYTVAPFPARFNHQPSVVALFGTGWRNSSSSSVGVTATVGGRAAIVEYAGASGDFPGLDQINLRLPDNTDGTAPVILRTADGAATSRSDVVIKVN